MYSTIAMTCATVALAVTVGIAVAVKNGTPYIVLDETSDWEVVWSVQYLPTCTITSLAHCCTNTNPESIYHNHRISTSRTTSHANAL
jgi:hypothetical protein